MKSNAKTAIKIAAYFRRNRVVLAPFQINAMFSRNWPIQESIPVGCVPPAIYRTGSLSGGLYPGGSLSRGVSVQGGLCPGGSLSRGLCLCLGGLCLEILCPGVSVNVRSHLCSCRLWQTSSGLVRSHPLGTGASLHLKIRASQPN